MKRRPTPLAGRRAGPRPTVDCVRAATACDGPHPRLGFVASRSRRVPTLRGGVGTALRGSGRECFRAGEAVLEVGGCAGAPGSRPRIRGRRGLPGADSPLVTEFLAAPGADFPLLARPANGARSRDRKLWASAARQLLDRRLDEAGAILLRGLPLSTPAEFSEFFLALGYEPVPYHGFATRQEVAPGVFTGNTRNPEQAIMLHNDMSHDPIMPRHLFLYCARPAPEGSGGETPIARSSDWREVLDPELWQRFGELGFLRLSNSPTRGDPSKSSLPWQDRYATDDPSLAEQKCRALGDTVSWEEDGSLSTRRRVAALREHRGETVWCCTPQSTRPVSSLELLYGNGEPIEPQVLELLRALQWNISVGFAWQRGDVLCLDNVACQHGRLPFATGVEREVLVSLATPVPGTCQTAPPAGAPER